MLSYLLEKEDARHEVVTGEQMLSYLLDKEDTRKEVVTGEQLLSYLLEKEDARHEVMTGEQLLSYLLEKEDARQEVVTGQEMLSYMLEKEPVVSGEDMLSYFLNVPSASPMPSPRSSEAGLETGFDLLEHLGFSQTTKEQMFVELVLSQLDKKFSGADLLEALQTKNLLEAGQKARLEEHLHKKNFQISGEMLYLYLQQNERLSMQGTGAEGGIDADSSDSFDDVVDLWEAMPVDIDDCLSDMSKCDPEAGAEILRAVTHSPSVNLLDKLAAYFCRSGQHRTLPICSTVTDMDHADDEGVSKRPVTATQAPSKSFLAHLTPVSP